MFLKKKLEICCTRKNELLFSLQVCKKSTTRRIKHDTQQSDICALQVF